MCEHYKRSQESPTCIEETIDVDMSQSMYNKEKIEVSIQNQETVTDTCSGESLVICLFYIGNVLHIFLYLHRGQSWS